MDAQKFAAGFLRAVGLLLIVLGLVHIAATPHIPHLLDSSPSAVYERAVGPTLLNHVLVGILLLPLGYSTWLAAGARNLGQAWATRIIVANTVVMLTLPVSVAVFMRRPEYYTAPLFVTGVTLVAIISLFMLAAAYAVTSGRGSRPPG